MAVAVVARQPAEAMVRALVAVMAVAVVEADLAEVPAPRTRVSHAKTPATDSHRANPVRPRHRASAMHKHHASTLNSSARTHAARV